MKLKNNRGNILLQVILILSATLIIVFMFSQQMSINRKEQVRLRTIINVVMVRSNIMSYLQDPAAWSATLQANTSTMACLSVHSQCSGGGPVKVMSSSSSVPLYDSTLATSGFRLDGTPCNSFSLNGNDECPIRADITWAPVCPPPMLSCVPTSVKLSGDFMVKARSSDFQTSINNHHFEFIRSVTP